MEEDRQHSPLASTCRKICTHAHSHRARAEGDWQEVAGRGGLTLKGALSVFLEHAALFLCPRKQVCILTEDKKENGVLFSLSTQVSLEGKNFKHVSKAMLAFFKKKSLS